MRIWTVHEPRQAATDSERMDRTVFVKDGFSWLGFLFSLPWLLFNRLWLGTLIYLLASLATGLAAQFLPLEGWSSFLLSLLPGLYAGFEGNDLRRRKLARRGFGQVASVAAKSGIEAETAFFLERGEQDSSTVTIARPAGGSGRGLVRRAAGPENEVLGLFPQPQVRI